jgi:hypothetical protein
LRKVEFRNEGFAGIGDLGICFSWDFCLMLGLMTISIPAFHAVIPANPSDFNPRVSRSNPS